MKQEPTPKTLRIVPNIERVLIKLLNESQMRQISNVIVPGQLKAGENLLYGEVVDGGNTKFKTGDRVYYSEYSTAALIPIGKVESGEMTFGEANQEKNRLYIVAEDDIMAYEEYSGPRKSLDPLPMTSKDAKFITDL